MTTPIITQLPTLSLQDITNARGLKVESEKRRPSKENLLDALSKDVEKQGIKAFLTCLKVEDLQDLSAKIKMKKLTSNGANNPNNKAVLSKRLIEEMTKNGITDFFVSLKLSENRLLELLISIGVAKPAECKKSELIEMIKKEILSMGLSAVFSNCTVKQLKTFAKDLNLNVDTNAKTVLLRCILNMKDYTAEDKAKANRKPKVAKTKAEPGEEDPMADYVDLPRCPPPKFDWSVSESDSDDFEEKSQPSEDVDMSDVASEKSEASEVEDKEKSGSVEESDDAAADGGEFVCRSSESENSDDMDVDEKPRKSYKKRTSKPKKKTNSKTKVKRGKSSSSKSNHSKSKKDKSKKDESSSESDE
jgi:hypothetical protein